VSEHSNLDPTLVPHTEAADAADALDAARAAARGRTSFSASTTRLLIVGLLLLAVLPPLGVLVAGVMMERHESRAEASAIGWAITHESPAQPQALQALLSRTCGAANHWCEALAADGRVIAAGGDPASRGAEFLRNAVPVEGHGPPSSLRSLPPEGVVSGFGWPGATDGPVTAVRVRAAADGVVLASAIAGVLSCAAVWLIWGFAVRRSIVVLRKAEGRLRSISVVDPLSGLLNRAGLRARLARGLARHGAARERVGVIVFDLDRFRLINQSLGRQAGDQLLREVARRIQAVSSPGDVAARLGGDQFAFASANLAGTQAAMAMARNLLRAIEPAAELGTRDAGIDGIDAHLGVHEAQVSVSVGVALADDGVESADELLARAEAAMRSAKASGGGRMRLYEASMLAGQQQQLALDLAIRRAVQHDEFELLYQPIVAADGESIHAVEALLRWNDPVRRTQVSPVEFIPVLEQTGLIVPVGQWVLRKACRQLRHWMARGAGPVTLSVNVSPIQFAEPDFVHQVLAAVQDAGVPAHCLQLEVTEGLLLDPTPEAMRKLEALVDAGVKLAIDDFGMGYSSMLYLKRFRLHTLKIDRLFVRDVPAVEKDTAIVRAMVDLAHALELHVTAEGVETQAQFDALVRLSCDSVQGFLFMRPSKPDAMLDRLLWQPELDNTDVPPQDWSTTMADGIFATARE
jgi:diguanylate cyclase (GGDEF)-like protein